MTRRSRSLRFERLEDRQNPSSVVPQFLLDPTFGNGGTAFVNSDLGPLFASVADSEIDADGRIWILGNIAGVAAVARFRPDGTPDASFDGDGFRTLAPWTEGIGSLYLNKLALLPDGDAVVAGQVNRNPNVPIPADSRLFAPYYSDSEFVAIRMNGDGSLDAAFGDGGRAVVPLDGDNSNSLNVLGLSVLADGRVVLGGLINNYYYAFSPVADASVASIPPVYSPPRFAIVRLTADGRPDPTFDADGSITFPSREGNFEQFVAMTVRPDGRATVLGTRSEIGNLRAFVTAYRFDAAGQPDATFDGDGHAEIFLGEQDAVANGSASISAGGGFAAAQADGGVVFGTTVYRSVYQNEPYLSKSSTDFTVMRFTETGARDSAFGTAGFIVRNLSQYDSSDFTSVSISKNPVALQGFADGSFAVLENTQRSYPYPVLSEATSVYVPPVTTTSLARYDAAGRPLGDAVRGFEFTFPSSSTPGTAIRPGEVFFDAQNRMIAVGTTDTSSVTGTRLAAARLTPVEMLISNAFEQTIFVSPGNGEVVAVRVDANSPAIVGPGSHPFGPFDGSVQALLADLDGDGRLDEIYGIGEGGGSMVLAYFRNADGTVVEAANFSAFEETFRGGIAIAAGDLDGDGQAEVILSAGNGGGGRVQIYSISRTGREKHADFFGIEDDSFRGGATTAIADLDGDGIPDLIVAAGEGGGPRVAVFDGETLLSKDVGLAPPKMMNDFFAFGGDDSGRMRNGVTVSAADLNGDGRQDLIFGAGPGGARRILGIDGAQFANGKTTTVVNFFVGNDEVSREGVQVSVKDVNQDGLPDLVVGRGPQLRIYDGDQLSSGNGQEPGVLRDVIVFSDGSEGIFVG